MNSKPNVSQEKYEPENRSVENEKVKPSRVDTNIVIKSLKNNKIAEEDRTCRELLKLGGLDIVNEIFKLISLVWHKETILVE